MRLELKLGSKGALTTITGQSRAVSKFGGMAIVTNVWVTGESLPRPATMRSSVGNSTSNSRNVAALRPDAASKSVAISDVSSIGSRRIISGRT